MSNIRNPYLEKSKEVNELEITISITSDHYSEHFSEEECQKATKKLNELKKSCTHQDNEGVLSYGWSLFTKECRCKICEEILV